MCYETADRKQLKVREKQKNISQGGTSMMHPGIVDFEIFPGLKTTWIVLFIGGLRTTPQMIMMGQSLMLVLSISDCRE